MECSALCSSPSSANLSQHGRAILIKSGTQQQAKYLAVTTYSRLYSVGFQKLIVECVARAACDGNRVPSNAIGDSTEVDARALLEPPGHAVAIGPRQRPDDRSI